MTRLPRRLLGMVGASALLGAGLVLNPLPPALGATRAADDCTPGIIGRIPGPPAAFDLLEADPMEPGPRGSGVIVAVVDSGIDITRPQLAEAVIGGVSLINDGERPDGFGDPNGHGTAIAGIIGARAAAGSGVVGLAPEAQLLSVRVFRGSDEQSQKDGVGPDAVRIAEGIRYATAHGARVITVAMSDDVETAELRSAVEEATAAGALVVASAGNRATTTNQIDSTRYPAAYPGVLSVTAVNAIGLPTTDSIHGDHIDVAAPGQDVLTTATGAGDCRYAVEAPSTSFATGYAAAAAALIVEEHPGETPEQWAYRLKATADRPQADRSDTERGWGMIRPFDAIALLPASDTRGPASPFMENAGSAIIPPAVHLTVGDTPRPREAATTIAVIGGSALLAVLTMLGLGTRILRRRREAAAAR